MTIIVGIMHSSKERRGDAVEHEDATVLLSFDGPIAELTLNRPRYRNAMDLAALEALETAVARLAAERPRAVLVRGAGPAFCSGIDLRAMREASPEATRYLVATMHRALGAFRRLPIPVVAALDGACVGLGVELAISVDLRVATPEARFSYREPAMAIPSPAHHLIQVIGLAHAQDLLLTARWVDAAEAAAMGLVTRVAPDAVAAARETALQIAELAPLAVAATKENIWRSIGAGEEAATLHHIEEATVARQTADGQEALDAFAAKRTPRFTGR